MRDYTRYSFYLTILVMVGLLGISRIPAFTVAGVKFKRANIVSDLYRYDDETATDEDAGLSRDDLDFIRDMEDAANYAAEGEDDIPDEPAEPENQPGQQTWDFGGDTGVGTTDAGTGRAEIQLDGVTVIEDYSPDGAIHRFGELLGSATRSRNVRIAFLGDSFIEGDIITADVREQLQEMYGGQGVGFVAMASITAEYRPTVRHTFRGWKDYLLANKKNVPEWYGDRFYVSGIISAPVSDAWSQYETTTYRKHIGEVPVVRFFYSSMVPADILFQVNDTHERSFPADSSGAVQQINISGSGIRKVHVSVPPTEGFAGYGISFEGRNGVLVDNYSIRSSTGLSLFGTSAAVNSAMNRMLGYDLIVLQYGLNIMSAEVTGYSSYGEQFRNLINYIKRCFPSAAIIVMGVRDRSMQSGGEFVTMPAVPAMVKEQRSAAEECGVAFWNTYQAMGGYNSMRRFAEWGWAAKDYTHLSFGGGRKIATEFVKAIEYARLNAYSPSGEGEEDGGELPVRYEPPVTGQEDSIAAGHAAGAVREDRSEPGGVSDWNFDDSPPGEEVGLAEDSPLAETIDPTGPDEPFNDDPEVTNHEDNSGGSDQVIDSADGDIIDDNGEQAEESGKVQDLPDPVPGEENTNNLR
ncbi:MAG: hypothetical protein LIO85_08645 [Rikenellaceae bacterium]|nr:hypothetical protein [Rikenellaceae bacterium]